MLGLSENSSYPPIFRQTNLPTPPPSLYDHSNSTIDLPLIDLQNLSPASLGEVAKEWGIFRLVNHGIPPSLSIQIREEAKKLLSHAFESKQTPGFFPHPINYFWDRAFFPRKVGFVNWLDGLRVSFNEFQRDGIGNRDSNFNDNSYRCLVEELRRHLAPITWALFKALAPELKLEGDHLASYLDDSESSIVALRYLRCALPDRHLGFDPHTDGTIFTILDQDDVGGLQILRNHQWFDVPHVPNTFIVFLGDMLKIISGEEYKSVEHRVLASKSKERISIIYIALPKMDTVISSSKYRPFTFEEFKAKLQEDFCKLGYRIGIEHFKIKDNQNSESS